MQKLMQTERHGQDHDPYIFSRELSRFVKWRTEFGSYWKLHKIEFTKGFTVRHILYETSNLS
ncbi:hypothetical protein KY289_033583 [Solanum tuberosum]|nr:hypothetical protein KY289_033583 [Solanum tuberosum]